jgi:hypothetical protein
MKFWLKQLSIGSMRDRSHQARSRGLSATTSEDTVPEVSHDLGGGPKPGSNPAGDATRISPEHLNIRAPSRDWANKRRDVSIRAQGVIDCAEEMLKFHPVNDLQVSWGTNHCRNI